MGYVAAVVNDGRMSQCPVPAVPRRRSVQRPVRARITINGPAGPWSTPPPGPGPAMLQGAAEIRRRLMHERWLRV
jgi:hypothetical protein